MYSHEVSPKIVVLIHGKYWLIFFLSSFLSEKKDTAKVMLDICLECVRKLVINVPKN